MKVSIELPVTTRHRHDMTEKLLKVTLNPNNNKNSSIYCERTAVAMTRLHRCAGSPDPALFAIVVSTIFIRAGSDLHLLTYFLVTQDTVLFELNLSTIFVIATLIFSTDL